MLNIYLTDLAAYNQGHLIGDWISLPTTVEDLNFALGTILKNGQNVCKDDLAHEEFFITDYECSSIDLFDVDEYEDIFALNDKLTLLEDTDLSEYELKSVKFLLANGLVGSLEEAIEKRDEVIIYEDSTMEEIAYDLVQECYDLDNIPSLISSHIDFEGIGRELEFDGTYFKEGPDIFEYRN